MNLSKTTEYSIRILSFMATREEPLYSADYLHEQLKIPQRYLRRLMTLLSKAGFISGSRGRTGGFIFARDPSTITLSEIIDLTEGPDSMNTCLLGFTACALNQPCAMHEKWEEVRNNMLNVLRTTSLGEIRDKYRITTLNI